MTGRPQTWCRKPAVMTVHHLMSVHNVRSDMSGTSAEGGRRRIGCPVCGQENIFRDTGRFFSMTVTCQGCDSSLGLCVTSSSVSVVHTEVPREKWKDPDPLDEFKTP